MPWRSPCPGRLLLSGKLYDFKQLLPHRDELLDGGSAGNPLRLLRCLLSAAGRGAKCVDALAHFGGNIERLQLEGDSQQSRSAFAGDLECEAGFAPLDSGECRLREHGTGLTDERAGLGFLEPFAEQQQERFARAREVGRSLVPLAILSQRPGEQAGGAKC